MITKTNNLHETHVKEPNPQVRAEVDRVEMFNVEIEQPNLCKSCGQLICIECNNCHHDICPKYRDCN